MEDCLYSKSMLLKTTIVVDPATDIEKQAQCCFDHEYQMLSRHSDAPLSDRRLERYLVEQHGASTARAQCIVVYKFPLQQSRLMELVKEKEWKATIWDYDPDHQKLEISALGESGGAVRQDVTNLVQIEGDDKITRVYILPYSHAEDNDNPHLTRAIHQSFRLLRNLKEYLDLQTSCEVNLSLAEPLSAGLSTYLYRQKVQNIQVILWIDQNIFDKSMLHRIGELKLPSWWLDKQEYRAKKTELFDMKLEEFSQLARFKKQKEGFTDKIWNIQRLVGMEQESYSKITVDTLRNIKQEGLSQKAGQIRQIEETITALNKRIKQLASLKQGYQHKWEEQKREQEETISNLKKDVLDAKPQTTTHLTKSTVFLRTDSQPMKNSSLFSQKSKRNGNGALSGQPPMTDKSDKVVSNPTGSESVRETTKKTSQGHGAKEKPKRSFKSRERGVASVVKEGAKQKVNATQLRALYEAVTLQVDFSVQKKLEEMMFRYEEAGDALQRLLLNPDSILI